MCFYCYIPHHIYFFDCTTGKIRVYVRVRPFSKSELAKNCEESVVKDGKMTVLVKGLGTPDAKKYYDFDQVKLLSPVCSRGLAASHGSSNSNLISIFSLFLALLCDFSNRYLVVRMATHKRMCSRTQSILLCRWSTVTTCASLLMDRLALER